MLKIVEADYLDIHGKQEEVQGKFDVRMDKIYELRIFRRVLQSGCFAFSGIAFKQLECVTIQNIIDKFYVAPVVVKLDAEE